MNLRSVFVLFACPIVFTWSFRSIRHTVTITVQHPRQDSNLRYYSLEGCGLIRSSHEGIVFTAGFEPATSRFGGECSVPLNYMKIVSSEGFEPPTPGLGNRSSILAELRGDEKALSPAADPYVRQLTIRERDKLCCGYSCYVPTEGVAPSRSFERRILSPL